MMRRVSNDTEEDPNANSTLGCFCQPYQFGSPIVPTMIEQASTPEQKSVYKLEGYQNIKIHSEYG